MKMTNRLCLSRALFFGLLLISLLSVFCVRTSAHSLFQAGVQDQECVTGGGYEQVMLHGLEAFYRTDWTVAERCFNRLESIDPEDPRALFFLAMMPFWEYYFVGREPSAAERFMALSGLAIERAERRLSEDPDNLNLLAMLSGLYGYQSLVASEESRIRTALQSGRSGFGYTQQLLKRQENSPEVDIGRGIYHYMVGSIPGSLRWLVALFGLSGDREAGFTYLKRAADSESFVRLDAKVVLGTIYRREKRFEQALDYTSRLVEQYGENIIFLYLHAELLEMAGYDYRAIAVYREVAGMNHDRLYQLVERSRDKVQEMTSENRSAGREAKVHTGRYSGGIVD